MNGTHLTRARGAIERLRRRWRRPKRRPAQRRPSGVDLQDVIVTVGAGLIVAGLVGYDWRVAAIVAGAVLLYLGLRMES